MLDSIPKSYTLNPRISESLSSRSSGKPSLETDIPCAENSAPPLQRIAVHLRVVTGRLRMGPLYTTQGPIHQNSFKEGKEPYEGPHVTALGTSAHPMLGVGFRV